MMIIMDKSLDLSTRERVQHLYNKNVELENRRRRSAQAKIPSDAWQQMRENYEAIILDDHAFSEQHDIEYALWQLHYRRIEELRAHYNAALASNASATSQGGKYSSRLDRVTKIRSQFKTFLSEAAGFYHDLMQKIRAKHGLPLFYFSDVQQNQIVISGEVNKSSEIKKDLLSCHRCFIYLGDLSRYKGLYGEGDSKNSDFAAASSYYLQASTLCPSNGNPHHQLAILASYSGDELVAIYRYFRSLAVDNPFSTARDNLIIAFEKNRQSFSQLPGNHKASLVNTTPVRMTGKGCRKVAATAPLKVDKIEARVVNESASSTAETFRAFCIRFLRLNGVLFTRTSFETFEDVLSMVRDDLLELLSSGVEDMYNFGSSAADNGLVIIRLVTILIFTAHDVNKESGNQSYAEILQRSVLLQNLYTAIFEFMGHIVERCIQLHNPSASFLLSGVLVFMEWLACHPDIAAGSEVEAKQATARSHFWNNYISLLNKLISSGNIFINGDETCIFSMSKYDEGETANRLALWEDFELRGYLPLVPAQLILDFSRKQSFGGDGTDKEKKARVQRIIAAGKAVISVVQVGSEGMYFDPQLKKFAIGVLPQISNDFELDSPLEVPASNCIGQEHPVDKKTNLGLFQPKAETYIADDEEDEVIVFKPSMVDKHVDLRVELPLYDVLRPSSNNSQGDLGSHVGSVSPPLVDIFPQNAFHTNFWPHTSLATMAHQQLEAKEPSASRWMLEQQTSIANGMNNLNLMGNGLLTKPGLQDHLGLFQPAAFSGPLPPMNLVSHNEHSGLVADTVIPSKSDSILLNGGSSDILLGNSSSIFPVYSRKNPVCRPSRCCGPLPAFSTVPPKLVDDSLSGATLKNDNMQMDDFSWLDGHQLPSSTKGTGNYSVNHSAQSYHHGIPSEYLMGTVTFPFPGKQVSNLQAQFENQKSWQDYQVPNHLKLYQKQQQQQQQFQKINQKSIGLPKQYEGQFLWEGRFIV